MSYTEFRDGYKKETTPGESIITVVGDTTYLFGAVSQQSDHTSPVAMTRYVPTGVNAKEVGAGEMWKSHMIVMGMYGITIQNGVPLWAVMGKSATVGTVHTITPTTDGTPVPSFTLNSEQKGSATDEEYQFTGCKFDSLALVHDFENTPFLMGFAEIRGLKAQDGIALTNSPTLPTTANTDAYVNLERIWDVGGTPVAIDGLKHVSINIANGLRPIYGHTYDGATYTGMWPYELIEKQRKEYKITMQLHPTTIERRMWDSLIGTGTAITSTFTWARALDDYIEVTAVGPVVEHQIITPEVGEELIEQVVIEPYSMIIEVEDALAAGDYS